MRQPAPPQHTQEQANHDQPDPAATTGNQPSVAQVKAIFGRLPQEMAHPSGPGTAAMVDLGRQLYYEKRLSSNHDISCNTCHELNRYGVDTRTPNATSLGHGGAFGDRNSPTVYNAALHLAQFWDGRAKDVEEQAKGPILNKVEMAMPDEKSVLKTLRSIPGYTAMFQAAFPHDPAPISYDNMARAIGAFERGLVTPGPFDAWLGGDKDALTTQQIHGLQVFLDSGCTACHSGPAVGGRMYQKLGLLKDYPTADPGRAKVTGNIAEQHMFKVPSLRNIAETAPYLHDGSIGSLQDMVALMVEYQTPKGKLDAAEMADLLAFLRALSGELPESYIAEPEPLPSGPTTPKPNPS